MDRQVSKINKSDGRDRWWKIEQEGKEAFRNRDLLPYERNSEDGRSWIKGWRDALEELLVKLKR